jgi:AcrR family transcriptional regulator
MAAEPPVRRGRPRDEHLTAHRREEILDVAARVFAARGYPKTDLQIVADELGVGKGTVYRYFATKQELFLAAVDRAMRRLTDYIHASMTDSDLLKQMDQAIRAYLEFFAANAEVAELLIQERAEFRDRLKPTYFEHRDANEGMWEERLRALIAAGRMRDVPVGRVLSVMGDLIYGTMFTNYFTGRRLSPKEQAAEILDVTLYGLLSDAERSQRAAGAR